MKVFKKLDKKGRKRVYIELNWKEWLLAVALGISTDYWMMNSGAVTGDTGGIIFGYVLFFVLWTATYWALYSAFGIAYFSRKGLVQEITQ